MAKKKSTRKSVKVAPNEPKKTLVLRTCNAKMQSHGGFQWPETGEVVAPNWKPTKECGNGLHGWLHGKGDWSLRCRDNDAWWLVVEVDESGIIDLGGKVKFERGVVLAKFPSWPKALGFIEGRLSIQPESVATGDCGHASATGDCGCGFSGFGGKAKASKNGAFAIAWFDKAANRARIVVGTTGENGIKPDTWYRVNEQGNLQEVTS